MDMTPAMAQFSSTTKVFGMLLTGLVLLLSFRYFRQYLRRRSVRSIIAKAKQIIAQGAHLSPQHATKHIKDAIRARGLTNTRIGKVFGLLNAFTTTEPKQRSDFKKLASKKLDSADWIGLARAAKLSLQKAIHTAKQKASDSGHPVQHFVRHLTFTVALQVLFGVPAEELDEDAVNNATQDINRLWLLAKDNKLENLDAFDEQHTLRRALSRLLPNETIAAGKDNPLNLIIPAFEAIWRVVLLGFLECAHHIFTTQSRTYNSRKEIHEPSREAFKIFLANPNMPRPARPLKPCEETAPFTVFDIAKEALRLYPCTKSVYRSVNNPDTGMLETHQAKVEELHHLNEGVFLLKTSSGMTITADEFYPRRWMHPQAEFAVDAYIPFGVRPLECPAKPDFGERMIALLIGTLVMGLDEYKVEDKMPGDECLRSDMPLPSGTEELGRYVVLLSKEEEEAELKKFAAESDKARKLEEARKRKVGR